MFFFLPLMLLAYYIAPRRARNAVLLAGSLVFYAWSGLKYLPLMLGVIALNYCAGLLIERFPARGKALLVCACVCNLALLGWFKYASFLLESLQRILPFLRGVRLPKTTLPVGISFYTFQAMSYTADVYRRTVRAQRDPIAFGAYVAMFPQLIAGPIVRYSDVEGQLLSRRETAERFSSGIPVFVLGLAKKVLLANPLGALFAACRAGSGAASAWAGVAACTLQIYFDFSGYSDMALGLGRMFGFELPINFRYPYIASSITDFWRRWHITLSTWFREYVYIPLGGNRRGKMRQLLNLLIVWLLTGLWHGASWNFVLWGLWYAVLLILEKTLRLPERKIPAVLRHVIVLAAVCFGWLLFFLEDPEELGAYLTRLFAFAGGGETELHTVLAYLPTLLVGAFVSTPAAANFFRKRAACRPVRIAGEIGLGLLFVLSAASLVSGSFNPFLYFRF